MSEGDVVRLDGRRHALVLHVLDDGLLDLIYVWQGKVRLRREVDYYRPDLDQPHWWQLEP